MKPVKVNDEYGQQEKMLNTIDYAVSVLNETHESNVNKDREIIKIEFKNSIFTRQAEVGKLYAIKNEIIRKIVESGKMVHLYTDSCGIKYGTPIGIHKRYIDSITYKPDCQIPSALLI